MGQPPAADAPATRQPPPRRDLDGRAQAPAAAAAIGLTASAADLGSPLSPAEPHFLSGSGAHGSGRASREGLSAGYAGLRVNARFGQGRPILRVGHGAGQRPEPANRAEAPHARRSTRLPNQRSASGVPLGVPDAQLDQFVLGCGINHGGSTVRARQICTRQRKHAADYSLALAGCRHRYRITGDDKRDPGTAFPFQLDEGIQFRGGAGADNEPNASGNSLPSNQAPISIFPKAASNRAASTETSMTQTSGNDLLTISALAERSGHRPSALRYYEEIGLLKPARRISRRRRYDPETVHQLALIDLYQEVGFTLAEIRALLPQRKSTRRRWETLAYAKVRELDETIQKAQAATRLLNETIRCRCTRLDGCELVLAAGERRRVHRRSRKVPIACARG